MRIAHKSGPFDAVADMLRMFGIRPSAPCGAIATHGSWETVGTLISTEGMIEEIPRCGISEHQAAVLRAYAVVASVDRGTVPGWRSDPDIGLMVDIRVRCQDRVRSASSCPSEVRAVLPTAGSIVPSGR